MGKLTVIKRDGDYVNPSTGKKRPRYLCKCECGKEIVVIGCELTRKHHAQQSCGCAKGGKREHAGRKKNKLDKS